MKYFIFIFGLLPLCINGQVSIPEMEAKAQRDLINYSLNTETQDYDLTYCRLELQIDPNEAYIAGDVTAYFRAKESLSEVVFDLKSNMNVSQVMHQGATLPFSQVNDNLIIDLPKSQTEGNLDSLTISYSGYPADGGFGYFKQSQHQGNEIVWTLSEPYGAKYWWPCKQDLTDKMDSLDVFITFPEYNSLNNKNVAVSNGIEISQTLDGDMKTTHFHHSYPIPAYLVGVAVSNYTIYTEQVENKGNPFPIINYVYPEDKNSIQQQTAITPELIDFYTQKFGEYPYADEKYGHCQFGWGGGMEHTTVSFMGGFSQELIAHELGHQWFGDKVTCAGWQNVWLNEGFANFMYALVRQHFNGEESYKNWREDAVNNITSLPGGSVYVPAEDTTNISRVFDGRLSYDKGGMVLDMLRRKLGEEDFFQALRNYLDNPDFAYGYANTEDLKMELEKQSDLNLTEFFKDWIYGEGYPTYHLNWEQNKNGNLHIILSQEQSKFVSVNFFEGVVPVRLKGSNDQFLDVELTQIQNNQNFTVDPRFEVHEILIDPDTEIIAGNNTSIAINAQELRQVKIYPNPARTEINISKPKGLIIETISIFDISGRLIIEKPFQETILINRLSAGLYFVKLQISSQNIIEPLLVE